MGNHAKNGLETGEPDHSDRKALTRAGTVLALADLFWLPQAGFIAWSLGAVLSRSVGIEDADAGFSQTASILTATFGVILIAVVRVYLQKLAQDMTRRSARNIQESARSALLLAAASRFPSDGFPSSGAFAAHVVDQVDLLGPFYRNYTPQLARLKLVPVCIVLADRKSVV